MGSQGANSRASERWSEGEFAGHASGESRAIGIWVLNSTRILWEVLCGPASNTLVTAAVTGGAPTTATGGAPLPTVVQLPTEGVGLEREHLFEGNEDYYGEDLGEAAHGGGA